MHADVAASILPEAFGAKEHNPLRLMQRFYLMQARGILWIDAIEHRFKLLKS